MVHVFFVWEMGMGHLFRVLASCYDYLHDWIPQVLFCCNGHSISLDCEQGLCPPLVDIGKLSVIVTSWVKDLPGALI